MTDPHFRDLDHVKAWLRQFENPEINSSAHEATIQMVALLGLALQKVIEEVEAVKADRPF